MKSQARNRALLKIRTRELPNYHLSSVLAAKQRLNKPQPVAQPAVLKQPKARSKYVDLQTLTDMMNGFYGSFANHQDSLDKIKKSVLQLKKIVKNLQQRHVQADLKPAYNFIGQSLAMKPYDVDQQDVEQQDVDQQSQAKQQHNEVLQKGRQAMQNRVDATDAEIEKIQPDPISLKTEAIKNLVQNGKMTVEQGENVVMNSSLFGNGTDEKSENEKSQDQKIVEQSLNVPQTKEIKLNDTAQNPKRISVQQLNKFEAALRQNGVLRPKNNRRKNKKIKERKKRLKAKKMAKQIAMQMQVKQI